jgi:hypothetical protein
MKNEKKKKALLSLGQFPVCKYHPLSPHKWRGLAVGAVFDAPSISGQWELERPRLQFHELLFHLSDKAEESQLESRFKGTPWGCTWP